MTVLSRFIFLTGMAAEDGRAFLSLARTKEDIALAGFCHHKCGTVYLEGVLRDLAVRTGMMFLPYADLGRPSPSKKKILFFHHGRLAVRLALKTLLSGIKIFHVIRDPRDVIVSGYFSHRYSHTEDTFWGRTVLRDRRRELASLSIEDGLLSEIRFGYALREMDAWEYGQKNVLEIKFEDLIRDPGKIFRRILVFAQLPVSDDVLETVMREHRFERLSAGRSPGEEDVHSHFRKGVPGDWRNHFTVRHIEEFKKRWGPLLIRLGYEKSHDWG